MTEPSITETRELPHEGTVLSFRKDIARAAMWAEQRQTAIYDAARDAGGKPLDDPNCVPLAMGAQAGWALASLLKWIENKVGAEQAYSAACLVQMLYVDGGTEGLCDDIAADLGLKPEGSTLATFQIPAAQLARAGERA